MRVIIYTVWGQIIKLACSLDIKSDLTLMLASILILLISLLSPIVAEFGVGSPMYMADEGTTLTVPIDLVNGELDGVSLTVEVSCSSNTATSK